MKTCLVEPTEKGYFISDGSASHRIKVKSTNRQTLVINDIFTTAKQIVTQELLKNSKRTLHNCSIRWVGIWNNKFEVGYRGFIEEDRKIETGKLYFDEEYEIMNKLCELQ